MLELLRLARRNLLIDTTVVASIYIYRTVCGSPETGKSIARFVCFELAFTGYVRLGGTGDGLWSVVVGVGFAKKTKRLTQNERRWE